MDTYEKKYNEALERARELAAKWTGKNKDFFIGDYAYIFPELRESEDERIRSEIIDYLGLVGKGDGDYAQPMIDRWIAWLGKQGCDVKGLKGPQEIGDWRGDEGVCKKQKESLHISEMCKENADSFTSEDERIRKEIIDIVEAYRANCVYEGTHRFDDCLAYLEKQEQKPNPTEDMPYITDEHFYEREPADSFKYKLAEYMTKCCTKKEGPYGYTYGISAESILKMAEEELLKRGVVQKPVECIEDSVKFEEGFKVGRESGLRDGQKYVLNNLDSYGLCKPAEWSEEDERRINAICELLENTSAIHPNYSHRELIIWLKFIRRPSWKPSKEQIQALSDALEFMPDYFKPKCTIESLRKQLERLI